MDMEDQRLAERCQALTKTALEAEAWVGDNGGIVGSQQTALRKDMRRAARFFRKCEHAARRKMCVGVFGPSQSGKSYLISALARSPEGGPLMARFPGIPAADFVEKINPEGGKEATGLVTRFTLGEPQGRTPDHPVRLRLLTETDLVRVLGNSYYADCRHKDAPDAEALASALDGLERIAAPTAPGTPPVSSDDVDDLRDYFNGNFADIARVQMLQRSYWQRAAALAPRLDLQGRARLFSLIWNGVPKFTELHIVLCRALESLGFPDEIDCSIDALLPRETSIIDVDMLKGLDAVLRGEDATHPLSVRSLRGVTATLPRSVVTALTAELTISIQDRPDDFFEYTDLLDFPGYRSRQKLDDIARELEREGTLEHLFLRGKVAYLFERYCEERELTSMLLCIGPSNQEVQDLPGAVHRWICATHGEQPESRAGHDPTLFLVLTKADMEFEKKAGASDVKDRWDIRFRASLLDFFGKQHDWPENWDGSRPFSNTFLLRNPNFRWDAMLNFDERGKEKEVRPEQAAYVESLRTAFMNSPLAKRHVDNQEEIWNAVMTLNDGGMGLLRRSLKPVCNPGLKRAQLAVTVKEQVEKLHAALKAWAPGDDLEERRREKEALARRLAKLLAGTAQDQLFGSLLGRLQVKDWELYELCRAVWRSAPAEEDAAAAAAPIGARVLADDLDIFGDADAGAAGTEPAAQEVPASRPVVRETDVLADRFMQFWMERLHDFADNEGECARFRLTAKDAGSLRSELVAAANRLKVHDRLADALAATAAYGNLERERLAWKLAAVGADAINAFVDWLGHDPRTLDDKARTILFMGRNHVLFAPHPTPVGEPQVPERQQASGQWYRDWLTALAHSIMGNVGDDGFGVADAGQVERLRAILRIWQRGGNA